MGKRGPAPQPTALRLLNGGHPERVNHHEPIAPDRLPLCPDDVSAEVRAIWDYTLGELVAMKIATSADRDSLRAYCEAVVAHRKACAILAVSPILVKGVLGNLVRNPAIQIQRDAAQTLRTFAQEFGLTPSARSQIETNKAAPSDEQNPFAEFGS